MADAEHVSVAGTLSAIAGGFPATETTFDTDPVTTNQLLPGSPRRIGFVVSNTTTQELILTTDPGMNLNSGWRIGPNSVEKFLIKDYGGLVMMPWFLQTGKAGIETFTVFEIYATRG